MEVESIELPPESKRCNVVENEPPLIVKYGKPMAVT